jgi:hypothetical protein
MFLGLDLAWLMRRQIEWMTIVAKKHPKLRFESSEGNIYEFPNRI